MSDSFQQDFTAYCVSTPPVESAALFSLKLERVDVGRVQRRYVDALLAVDNALVPVPFIFIRANGEPVLHECHSALSLPVKNWLLKTVRDWVASKPPDANMVADLFGGNQDLASRVVGAVNGERALIGLAAYASVFLEADRYASVSPFAMNRRVVDCNPGFGYGARTLHVASRVSVDEKALDPLADILLPRLTRDEKEADVAMYLDAAMPDPAVMLDRLNSMVTGNGAVLISLRGEDAPKRIEALGGDAIQITRPAGAALDEWLGIFRKQHPKVFSVAAPVEAPATVSPRPLRVLFGLRPSAEGIFGGDVVQVRETAQALRARGHDIVVSTAPSLDSNGFDIVHLSNLTVPAETVLQTRSVARFAGPIVMMPIFTDHSDEATWGMEAMTSAYATSEDASDLLQKLTLVEGRKARVGSYSPPPQRNDITENYTPLQRDILAGVDFLIANAHSEVNRLYRYLTCEVPYAIAPSAAKASIFGPHAKQRFLDRFGLEDFVLLAGRFEPRKNQLPFFEAMRSLTVPVLFVGGCRDAGYAQVLRLRRPGNAAYIGNLREEELAGAFAAARVVVIPSWDEVVSLTSLDAAISGASLVLSRNGYEHEYFQSDAYYCDPGSVTSIAASVKRACKTHAARAERRAALVDRVKREFSWERSAELTEAAYYRVLEFNPRGQERLSKAI